MQKRITITLSEEIYTGLRRSVDKGNISQFIENIIRPHVLDNRTLSDGYQAMANDQQRESEAKTWTANLTGKTLKHETW